MDPMLLHLRPALSQGIVWAVGVAGFSLLTGVFLTALTWGLILRRRVEKQAGLLSAALDSTADGILIVDRRGKMVAFSQRFVELWGIPQSIAKSRDDNQALSCVLSQLMHPEAFLARVRELYANPGAQSNDVLEFKDGRVFERRSEPLRVAGRIAGRVWGFRDVTSSRRLQGLLDQERHLLHVLLDELPDHIYFKDRDSRFTLVNKSHARRHGYDDPSQVVGKTDFDFFSAEHAQQAYDDEQDLVHERVPIISKEEKETWPDGHVSWVLTK